MKNMGKLTKFNYACYAELEVSWGHAIRSFRGPQGRDAYEIEGQRGKFEPFRTENLGAFEQDCPDAVIRVERNEGRISHRMPPLDTTRWGKCGRGNMKRPVVSFDHLLRIQPRWAGSVHDIFL